MNEKDKKRLADLETFLENAKIAVPWMVDTLKRATDDLHGCYSDHLNHAIELNEYAKLL